PGNYRGGHRLSRDEDGRVRCVACYMCATACPAHCIDIVAAPAPVEWKDREKYPETFVIDELRCIYCGMCEEACPVDAIELTTLYDLTGASREEMVFDKEKLLSVFDQTTKAGTDPVRSRGRGVPAAAEAGPAVGRRRGRRARRGAGGGRRLGGQDVRRAGHRLGRDGAVRPVLGRGARLRRGAGDAAEPGPRGDRVRVRHP